MLIIEDRMVLGRLNAHSSKSEYNLFTCTLYIYNRSVFLFFNCFFPSSLFVLSLHGHQKSCLNAAEEKGKSCTEEMREKKRIE